MNDICVFICCLVSLNLGDNFNDYFFTHLIDKKKIEYISITDVEKFNNVTENDIFIIGIGSIIIDAIKILNNIRKNIPAFKNFYFFSSGNKYKLIDSDVICYLKPENVISLRGNFTSILEHNFPVGDNGLYLSLIKDTNQSIITHEYEIGLIPHCIENDGLSLEIQHIFENCMEHHKCKREKTNFLFINIVSDLDKFINQIKKCKYILSGSLHGIIFSDALNIPAYHLKLTDRLCSDFKFEDYYSSVNRKYQNYRWNDFENIWNDENINKIKLPYYHKNINLLNSLNNFDRLDLSTKISNIQSRIRKNEVSYLHFNKEHINKSNIDKHITTVISSCLLIQEKFDCLIKVIDNINLFLPDTEIIVGFDKIGPNEKQIETLKKNRNLFFFVHQNGLGHSFNYAHQIAKNEIILQIEDDWIIDNKYLETSEDVKKLFFNSYLVLDKHKNCCVRLDGGMFDEIGGSDGYHLGWKRHEENDFTYCSYNLPSKKQMNENHWLHYAFCNHPHLKFKEITLKMPYPEDINPAVLENDYSVKWILENYNIYYVLINEESIKRGMYNSDKNIFKHIGYEFSYRI
jgi:hypothetical protein